MDPKCAITSRASTESDVYSFGVVLLEIACGRRPICPEEDESKVQLVYWVWKLYESVRLLDAVDPRLNAQFDVEEMKRVMVVGLWCVHPDCGFRPSIRQAMNVLQFEAPTPILPHEMPLPLYYGSDGTSSARSSGDGGESLISGPSASHNDHHIVK
ncbi:hypothetical protein PR202_ga16976 [Eleusine coracana subsp. coracana]|uniref:Serine-threonine/tyrosine-protein kinase catalytic domain-containing protein n=1 Tax=Eleusine coracana subsp. coracana TaxID=191504 RepID=A0AAV5CP40_ELECO|nr:hypothetical protein PR202_ga16976 [Eleusine coracana subsp. coracana]